MMFIGYDVSNGSDHSAVVLRIGPYCHIIPDPFARELIPILKAHDKLPDIVDRWKKSGENVWSVTAQDIKTLMQVAQSHIGITDEDSIKKDRSLMGPCET